MVSLQKIYINISQKNRDILDKIFIHLPDITISGGLVRSVVNEEPIRDIDICVKNDRFIFIINKILKLFDVTFVSIYNDFVKLEINEIGKEIDIINTGHVNAINYIQKNFDFSFTRLLLLKDENGYYIFGDESDFNDLVNKKLVYCGSDYPFSSRDRAKKFIEKGYKIDNYNLIKIMDDCSKEEIRLDKNIN